MLRSLVLINLPVGSVLVDPSSIINAVDQSDGTCVVQCRDADINMRLPLTVKALGEMLEEIALLSDVSILTPSLPTHLDPSKPLP